LTNQSEMRMMKTGNEMDGTYGQLSDGIVKDIERVGPGKVARDLDDQGGRVNHTGLND